VVLLVVRFIPLRFLRIEEADESSPSGSVVVGAAIVCESILPPCSFGPKWIVRLATRRSCSSECVTHNADIFRTRIVLSTCSSASSSNALQILAQWCESVG